ncbi:hypothetical protein Nepgr_010013 [Nepenthes gracilis]|uniref:Uncharacterized protein n=1 Tax=Nepenthes gracilis TaxID=150966 RepID=A0AAD3XKN6_NEPGR|nr:hypothetical protein Nepgr_010013 [Nepenthes gracilis]
MVEDRKPCIRVINRRVRASFHCLPSSSTAQREEEGRKVAKNRKEDGYDGNIMELLHYVWIRLCINHCLSHRFVAMKPLNSEDDAIPLHWFRTPYDLFRPNYLKDLRRLY